MEKTLVSIVIPVYNEEKILEKAVSELFKMLKKYEVDFDFELVLAENGSKDNTIKKGEELAKKYKNMIIFHHPEPDYGEALKAGIRKAKGEIIISDEIDLCLEEFYDNALKLFKETDVKMVVGSKAMKGAKDRRPFKRRLATFVLNKMLQIILGFKGTDTHGVKAFRKKELMPVLDKCVVGKDIFASEFVIRTQKAGLKILEVPISLDEKRAPSIKLMKRVPKVLSNIFHLFWVIRIKKDL
jgi:glycosyltransferase involved in cell wall biosynthesis